MHIFSLNNPSNVLSIIFFALLLFMLPSVTQAFYTASPVDLDGYAWSSNIGWISMNCATGGVSGGDVCGASNYKVTIGTDGSLTGYAWSSNIGWIKFGGLSDFPAVAPGVVATDAQLFDIGAGNFELRGWARACAGTTSGTCSTMASRADGWDGWISLSGNNHNVRFTATGPVTNSYAWGSTVVGWIDMFRYLNFVDVKHANITFGPPCTVARGDTECDGQLSYQFFNVTAADNPRIDRVSPLTEIANGPLSGTNVSVPMRAGINSYRAGITSNPNLVTRSIPISCVSGDSPTGVGGQCEPTDADGPTMDISVNKSLIRQGDRVSVSVSIAGDNPVCTLSGPGIVGQWLIYDAGGEPVYHVIDLESYTSQPLMNLARFFLTCTGIYPDETTREIQVRVVPTVTE